MTRGDSEVIGAHSTTNKDAGTVGDNRWPKTMLNSRTGKLIPRQAERKRGKQALERELAMTHFRTNLGGHPQQCSGGGFTSP